MVHFPDMLEHILCSNFLDLLAIMEKSRMYILRSMKPEEPVTSEAYAKHNMRYQASASSLLC